MLKPHTILLTALLSAGLTFIPCKNGNTADVKQNYAIWGEGGASCFRYSNARASEEDKQFKAYIRGYLTAFNTLSQDTYSITGALKLPEIMEWLDSYCDEKAIDSVDRAIQMLINQVEDKRYKTPVQQGISQGWGEGGSK